MTEGVDVREELMYAMGFIRRLGETLDDAF